MQAQPGRVPPAAAAAPAAIAPPGRLHHPEVLDERAHRGQRHHEQAVCRDARVGFAISALLPSVFSRRVFFLNIFVVISTINFSPVAQQFEKTL